MKRILITLLSFALIFSVKSQTKASLDCYNSGVELGNFNGWSAATNTIDPTNGTVNFGTNVPGFVNGRHTIMMQGTDLGIPLVSEGNYSIRLGNNSAGGQADLLKYTFVVSASNANFSFRYALVLEDGGHNANSQPALEYIIYKGSSWTAWTNPQNCIDGKQFAADPNDPFYNVTPNNVVWRNWTSECIDLTAHIGQTVSIVFLTKDCAQIAHFGYAYIDALCGPNNAVPQFSMPDTICMGQNLIADGTASSLENSCSWFIQEYTSGGQPVGQEYAFHPNGPATIMNLSAFMALQGQPLKCNTRYRVKLRVSNDCTPSAEQTKMVFVSCPTMPNVPDKFLCCNGTALQSVGFQTIPGQNYNWAVTPAYTFTSLGGNVTFNHPKENLSFTVTATNAAGCSSSQEIKVWVYPRFGVTIHSAPAGLNNTMLQANLIMKDCYNNPYSAAELADMESNITYSWSNGMNGKWIIVPNTPGTYTVTVSSPCLTQVHQIVIP